MAWFQQRPGFIFPLGKPHQALSSAGVFVCSVTSTLLWVKHSFVHFYSCGCGYCNLLANCDSIFYSLIVFHPLLDGKKGGQLRWVWSSHWVLNQHKHIFKNSSTWTLYLELLQFPLKCLQTECLQTEIHRGFPLENIQQTMYMQFPI